MKKNTRTLKCLLVTAFTVFSMAAHAADRNKTLSDVMQETMETKNIDYLLQTKGKPYSITNLKTLQLYEWNENTKNGDDICTQMYTANRSGKIVGWNTDCDSTTGNSSYGQTSENTPIPAPIIPKELSDFFEERKNRMLAQINESVAESHNFLARIHEEDEKKKAAKAKAASERRLTFPEILMSMVGKSEEEVITQNSDTLISNEKLANGKTIRGYRLEYFISRYSNLGYGYGVDYEQRTDCKYRLIFLKEKMIGYNAGDCPNDHQKDDTRRVPKNRPPTAPLAYP